MHGWKQGRGNGGLRRSDEQAFRVFEKDCGASITRDK
jgi:hypothetical protein